MRASGILFLLFLSGCVWPWRAPSEFQESIIDTDKYSIFTYQKITDSVSPIHIYIEGDGHAFDVAGRATADPTPRGTFLRDLAIRDTHINVAYMARPCQYVMSGGCNRSDWTDGRFSPEIIDSMSSAIKQVAQNRPIILIGYSGGAMISGLVILQNPNLDMQKWITIAGVLNHNDWTEYFGDTPLFRSLNIYELPHLPQIHYIADGDKVVPNSLSYKWLSDKRLELLPESSHTNIPNIKLDFAIDEQYQKEPKPVSTKSH